LATIDIFEQQVIDDGLVIETELENKAVLRGKWERPAQGMRCFEHRQPNPLHR
jgi:hypothetical protein